MKNTQIEKVREIAISLIYLPIKPAFIPIITSHPFTSSTIGMVYQNNKWQRVELLDPTNRSIWNNYMTQKIKKSNLDQILIMMNPPYILNFLYLARKYISDVDMGNALKGNWQKIEYISTDKSLSHEKILTLFQKSDKNSLMSNKMKFIYDNLPETVTIYRGVTGYNKKYKKAYSWTLSKEVAVWFAKRFDDKVQEVWTLSIPKNRIVALFDGNEKECVVDISKYETKIEIENVHILKKSTSTYLF